MMTFDAPRVEALIAAAQEWLAARNAVLAECAAQKSPLPSFGRLGSAEGALSVAIATLERPLFPDEEA